MVSTTLKLIEVGRYWGLQLDPPKEGVNLPGYYVGVAYSGKTVE